MGSTTFPSTELIPDFWLPSTSITVSPYQKTLGFFGKPWGRLLNLGRAQVVCRCRFHAEPLPPWGWPALSCTICWMKMSYRNGGRDEQWRSGVGSEGGFSREENEGNSNENHEGRNFSLRKGKSSHYQGPSSMHRILAGGFKYFLFLSPNLGEMLQIEEHIFQMGWFNHQLEFLDLKCSGPAGVLKNVLACH